MRKAETVTFGGAGLDRAAHLRNPGAQSELRHEPAARALVLWRGKPLMAGPESARAAWLPLDHPALEGAPAPIFLGMVEGVPRFAVDLSRWEPEGLDAAAMAAFVDPTEQHHPLMPGDHRFVELRRVMTRLDPLEAELAATARGLFNWHRTHGFCAVCGNRSEIVAGGWQRRCPACGAPHFPRSDPVVIMLVTDGNSILVGRSHSWPEGMYSLLAGFMEPGETVEAAVRREVFEESGVTVGDVAYLASQPWPFPSSLMLGCRGTALDRAIRRDPDELADARWMTREEMADAFAGIGGRVPPARPGAIAHHLIRAWLADRLD